jgi:hypothetical protein
MKKDKSQSLLKAARKKTRETVQKRLVSALQKITNELHQDGSKPSIDVEKESKKLAKKITKHFTASKEAEKDTIPAVANAAPVKENKVEPAKPTASKKAAPIAKKPVAKVAPTKPAAPKAVNNSLPKPVKK